MISKKQSNLILSALILLIVYLIFANKLPLIFSWDLFGSYIYLPMLFDQHNFIYQDFSYFEAVNNQHHLSDTLYQFVLNKNGQIMTKYTVGWSILMTPFYLIAELIAKLSGYKTDGFSHPYQLMIVLGNLFYFTVAVFQLRRLFTRFFSLSLATLLILLTFLSTNLLFAQYASLGSTHLIEFLLIILLINQTFKFYENISVQNAIILAIILAFVFLVRPPDIIFSLIPILWTNDQFPNVFKKLFFFVKNKFKILAIATLTFALLISIQFLYWKITSGKYIINSYANNAGEGFDWFTPYFQEFLFSYRKGWFIYTPITLLCIIGFYFWFKKEKNAISFFTSFIVFLYVICCWTTWWYADSYSSRAAIELYPILFIALGHLILALRQIKLKYILYFLILAFLSLNIFQTYQITNGILKTDLMTKDYYFSVFGQTSYPTKKQESLLSINRNVGHHSNLNESGGYIKAKTINYDYSEKITLTKEKIYTPIIEFKLDQLTNKSFCWIKAIWFYEGNLKSLNGKIFCGTTFYRDQGYGFKGSDISQKDFEVDTLKKQVCFYYLTPHLRTKKDPIRIGVWNQSGENIIFKKVKLEIFESKLSHE